MKYILHYFKSAQKDDERDVSLPNSHGPLSSKVPPGAIEVANKKVAEIVAPPAAADSEPTSSSRKRYIKLTPAQRLTEIFFLQVFRQLRFVEGDHRKEAEESVPRASLS